MKLNKKLITFSFAAALGINILGFSNEITHAADTSTVTKTIMHNAVAYNKDGKNTGVIFRAYSKVTVDNKPVTIGKEKYYKISTKD